MAPENDESDSAALVHDLCRESISDRGRGVTVSGKTGGRGRGEGECVEETSDEIEAAGMAADDDAADIESATGADTGADTDAVATTIGSAMRDSWFDPRVCSETAEFKVAGSMWCAPCFSCRGGDRKETRISPGGCESSSTLGGESWL